MTTSTPVAKPKPNVHKPPITGLNTPITTPAVNQALGQAGRRVQCTESPLATKAPPVPQQPQQNDHPLQQSHTAQPEVLNSTEDIADDDSFSYAFGSDDDAFLATVDLGEGDLGRPIDVNEGLGGTNLGQSTTALLDEDLLDTSSAHPPRQMQEEECSGLARGEPVPPPVPVLQNSNITRSSVFGGQGSSSSLSSGGLGNNEAPTRQQTTHQRPQQSAHSSNRPNENQNPSSHFNEALPPPSFKNINGSSTPSSTRRGGFSFPAEVVSHVTGLPRRLCFF